MQTKPFNAEVFKGIIPKLDPRLLDESHAQTAKNCDMRSGKLQLYTVPAASAAEEREIYDAGDVLDKPDKLVVAAAEYVLDPSTIECKWYGGTVAGEVTCEYKGCSRTDRSLVLRYWFPGKTYSALTALDVPTYRLTFNNGKETIHTPISASPYTGGDIISGDQILLYIPGADPEYSYGKMAVVGLKAVDFRIILLTPTTTSYNAHEVLITCDMLYADPVGVYCSYSLVEKNANGAESPASDPTDPILRRPGQKLTVTVPTPPDGGSWQLYRSSKVGGGTFQLLAEGDDSESYLDMLPDSFLGDQLPERLSFTESTSPVDKSIPASTDEWTKVAYLNNFYASFNGKTLYFSEPDYSHIWPDDYKLVFDETIIGVVDTRSGFLVITDGDPYMVSFSSHPKYATVYRIIMNGQQGCIGKGTIFKTNGVIGYVSEGGLILAGQGDASIASLSHYTPAQWKALLPTPRSGVQCYVDNDFLIIKLQTNNYLVWEFVNDKLGELTTNDGGAALTWKSKELTFGHPVEFNCVRVVADSYGSVIVNVYADGTLSQTRPIREGERDNVFKIENKHTAKRWAVEVVFTGASASERVHELSMAMRVDDLK